MKKYVLGVLVSADFEDLRQIKNAIYEARQRVGDNLEICQVTENYQYKEIKKFVQEMGVYYTDVLRFDEPFTLNSHDSNQFKFGKSFNGKFLHIRNSNFLTYSDGIFGFVTKSMTKEDSIYKILRKAKDKKMNLKLFS